MARNCRPVITDNDGTGNPQDYSCHGPYSCDVEMRLHARTVNGGLFIKLNNQWYYRPQFASSADGIGEETHLDRPGFHLEQRMRDPS